MYEGCHCKPFPGLQQLKEKNMEVLYEFAIVLHFIRNALKQILPGLRAVCKRGGESIKTLFG